MGCAVAMRCLNGFFSYVLTKSERVEYLFSFSFSTAPQVTASTSLHLTGHGK